MIDPEPRLTPPEVPEPLPDEPAPTAWYKHPWPIAWLIAIGGGLLIFVFCAASQILITPFFSMMSGMVNQMDMVGGFEVIDDYMTAMYYGDAERAYRYYSEDARERLTLTDIEAELNGPNADLYAQYDGWLMGDSEPPQQAMNPGATTFEDAMEGMRLNFEGTLYVFDGRDRYFRAVTVFEDGEWKLDVLNLEAAPDE